LRPRPGRRFSVTAISDHGLIDVVEPSVGGAQPSVAADRARVLAHGLDLAIEEFEHRHRGVVAVAKSSLHGAGIAAVAGLLARPAHIDQFLERSANEDDPRGA
jgi:hypothetical protein